MGAAWGKRGGFEDKEIRGVPHVITEETIPCSFEVGMVVRSLLTFEGKEWRFGKPPLFSNCHV